MLFDKANDIYNKAYELLGDSRFNYFKTRERGFYPRPLETLGPHLFPWAFVELVSISPVSVHRMPKIWEYELTLGVVMMTYADSGDPRTLSLKADTNQNKGIIDMVQDVSTVFWSAHKADRFGFAEVLDWNLGRQGFPTIPLIQITIANHPFIRGHQVDLVFRVAETI